MTILAVTQHRSLICVAVTAFTFHPSAASQPQPPVAEQASVLERLEQQQKLIEALQQEINALKRARYEDTDTQQKKVQASRDSSPSPDSTIPDEQPVGQKPPEPETYTRALPDVTTSNTGVLVGKGNFATELSLSYSYTDNNRVFLDGYSFIPALVVGLIDIREVKRHSYIASVSGKFGLTDRWEVEVKVPYVGRNDMVRSRPVSVSVSEDQVFNASGEDLGDVQVATRYQLNDASSDVIYVANLVATFPTGTSPFDVMFVETTPGAVFPTELPTGSGYRSYQPSLSAIYPTDPGIFFGNVSYAYNEEIIDDETVKIDAGDSVGLSFGLGLSLNERTSMSLSYSHKHVMKSKINDEKIEGSQLDIGQLIIGYSFRYTEQTNINMSLAVGVTEDAQDVRLNFRVPTTY